MNGAFPLKIKQRIFTKFLYKASLIVNAVGGESEAGSKR